MIHKATPKEEIIAIAECEKKCHGCQNGCKHGSGCLVEEDIPKIAKFLDVFEEDLKEYYLQKADRFNTLLWKPRFKTDRVYGECIFFNDGCTIHEVKPLECQIATCKEIGQETSLWFMLNHCVNPEDPESVRQFALYLKLGYPTLADGQLEDIVPDEELLRKILRHER